MPRVRLLERIGRWIGFSPEGRAVRVWVRSRPGEEDAIVVWGTIVELTERGAVLALDEPLRTDGRELARVLAVPREPGWGLDALWFTFIAVDAFADRSADEAPLGHWWLRLG
jgi:hypothetical protein